MRVKIKNPTKFEVDGLKSLCKNLNCSMAELISAIMSNSVSEEIGIQLHYTKYGCHPCEASPNQS